LHLDGDESITEEIYWRVIKNFKLKAIEQITEIILDLHNHGFMHRNIRLENFIIDKSRY
jgi:serine/threonine protein kinase